MHADITKYKVVSFDLWDTLLHRKCHPDEIKFQFSRWVWLNLSPKVQKMHTPESLYILRKNIEDTICNEDWEYRFTEVANELIKQIGGSVVFNCSITPALLEDVELGIENNLTFCRKDGLELLESACENCTKVILISDFYHSSEWLNKLLELKNIRKYFSQIYSSSDQLITKRSGKMYDILSTQFDKSTWLHIGDNIHADVNVPQEKGISALHLPQGAQEQFYKNRELAFRSQVLLNGSNNILHDLRLKKITTKLLPNISHSEITNDNELSLNQVGRKLALMLAGFILEIIEDSIRLRSKKIHFFSREGIFFKELYDIACSSDVYHLNHYAEGEILDVSRIATFAASLNDASVEEFMRIWRLYSRQSPAALLKSLNLSSEIDNMDSYYKGDMYSAVEYPWQDNNFIEFFNSVIFQEVVSKSIKNQRELFLNYAATKKLTLDDEVIQIVDIGWRGTIQDNIALIFEKSKVHGNYLGLEKFLNPQPSNTSKNGYIGNNNSDESDHFDFGDFAVFEFVCNVPGGSVVGYSKDSQVQRKIVDGEESVILNEGKKIQDGIKAALTEIFEYVKTSGLTSKSLINLARETVIDIKHNPPSSLCDAFNKLEHNEIFGTGSAEQILKESKISSLSEKSSAEKFFFFKDLWDKCRWKQSLTSSSSFQDYIKSATPLTKLSLPSNMFNLIFGGLNKIKVCIIVPHVIRGSGGHRTIFNLAKGLIRAGAQVEIQLEGFNEDVSYLRSEMMGYQYKLTQYWQPGTTCDVVIATVGYSPEFVAKEINSKFKFYLVQDYEASFNPVSDAFINIQNSYNYGLVPLCVGSWLPHVLKNQHNIQSFYSGLGSDPKIYHNLRLDRCFDVAFLYQPEKHRRLGDFCVKALNSLHKYMPNIKVISYGSQSRPPLCFDNEHLGLVSNLGKLNKIYNQSKLGLCISLTNPSRIPFEMMRAGCVPVDVFRYNNLFDYKSKSAFLSYQDSESIMSSIAYLLSNKAVLTEYSENALSFSASRTLDWEIEVLVNSINYAYHEMGAPPATPSLIYEQEPFIAQSEKIESSVQSFCNWQKKLSNSKL